MIATAVGDALGAIDGAIAGTVAASLAAHTVQVASGSRGTGSGVLWRADGLVITNAHVARAPDARIVLADGRTFRAHLIARDERCDLAALRLEHAWALEGGPAPTRDPRTLRVGEIVVALGAPWGIAGSAALGIVHAPPIVARGGRRGDGAGHDGAGHPELVRADIRLAPGNSGGPLADAEGRIVGVNAMIVGGLGIAVSVRTVERFIATVVGGARGPDDPRAAPSSSVLHERAGVAAGA
jgi:serine protease Do